MKILKRILLVFWGLFATALGVFVILCSTNSNIGAYWMEMLAGILNYLPAGLGVGAGFLAIGIVTVILGTYSRREMPFAKVSMGEFGTVDVSLAAVDNVVKKVAAGIDGVKDVKTRIKVENNIVGVLLDVIMLPDCNIPDTVALLQQDVRTQLETSVGLKVNDVKTAITNIVSGSK